MLKTNPTDRYRIAFQPTARQASHQRIDESSQHPTVPHDTMRIIGGSKAGLRLATPSGQGVRPTLDRVREAIFNRLAQEIIGTRVLDLFSGTGAMGIESLSRGAKSVISIEKSKHHAQFIKKNIRSCGYQSPQIQVQVACAFGKLRQLAHERDTFELILADPPFGQKTHKTPSQSIAQKLIDDPNLINITQPSSLLVFGHASRDQVIIPPTWETIKRQRYGDATINFLRPVQSRNDETLQADQLPLPSLEPKSRQNIQSG